MTIHELYLAALFALICIVILVLMFALHLTLWLIIPAFISGAIAVALADD
jgi:hypothetical protein